MPEIRVSVPVPEQLLQELRERPSEFGVANLPSDASRIRALVEAGAISERRRVTELAMAAAYDEWSQDRENNEATAALADILLAPGSSVDSLLKQPRTQRR